MIFFMAADKFKVFELRSNTALLSAKKWHESTRTSSTLSTGTNNKKSFMWDKLRIANKKIQQKEYITPENYNKTKQRNSYQTSPTFLSHCVICFPA